MVLMAIVIGSNYSILSLRSLPLRFYKEEKWGKSIIPEDIRNLVIQGKNRLKVFVRYIDEADEDIVRVKKLLDTIDRKADSWQGVLFLDPLKSSFENINQKIEGVKLREQDKKLLIDFIEEEKSFYYIAKN